MSPRTYEFIAEIIAEPDHGSAYIKIPFDVKPSSVRGVFPFAPKSGNKSMTAFTSS